MISTAVSRYQQVRNSTSTKGDLLLALYDGLFRFLGGARESLERGERGKAGELLSKSYAIVSELYIALDHEKYPELCANLEGVYGFCMDHITRANVTGRVDLIDDVLRVLTPLRQAWKVAVPKAAAEQAATQR